VGIKDQISNIRHGIHVCQIARSQSRVTFVISIETNSVDNGGQDLVRQSVCRLDKLGERSIFVIYISANVMMTCFH
jgi:hypothetical protein